MTVPIIILSILVYGSVVSWFVSFYRTERRAGTGGLADADAALAALPATDAEFVDANVAAGSTRKPPAPASPGEYTYVWEAFDGLAARMALLAITSDRLSRRCRQDALMGLPPTRLLADQDYCSELPAELREGARRPGRVKSWQALDRALSRVSAVHHSDAASAHADAHEQVSIAARELAEDLAEDRADADLDHCMFCQRGPAEVRLLCTPLAAICEECADACHTRFYEL
jgi:hypothetical protein